MENLHIFRGGMDLRLLGLLIDKGHARPSHRQQDDGEIGARKEQERGKEEYGEKAQMDDGHFLQPLGAGTRDLAAGDIRHHRAQGREERRKTP